MIKGLSLFANVGVAETYFYENGIDICVANELLDERSKFYSHLYPIHPSFSISPVRPGRRAFFCYFRLPESNQRASGAL